MDLLPAGILSERLSQKFINILFPVIAKSVNAYLHFFMGVFGLIDISAK